MGTKAMGYKNIDAALENVIATGKLNRPRGDDLSTDTTAFSVLMMLCHDTLDWPLDSKQKSHKNTSRLYTKGYKALVLQMNLVDLTPKQAFRDDADLIRARRQINAEKRIASAMRYLQKRGVVKQLVHSEFGNPASYLLLIGDDDENLEVENYDRMVLGLPKIINRE